MTESESDVCSALVCPGLPCPALPCPALPCPALPCPALLQSQQHYLSTGLYHAYHTLLILQHDTTTTFVVSNPSP